MEKEHKEAGYLAVFADEPKQRQIEKFFRVLNTDTPNWRTLPITECAGAYCRAAIASELLLGIDDVGDQNPAYILWLGEQVDDYIVEVMSVPNA